MGKKSGKKRKIRNFLESGNNICPLCRISLTTGNATVEHVPPKKLGGTPMCLTCRDCNNRFGRHYEAIMDRDMRGVKAWDFKGEDGQRFSMETKPCVLQTCPVPGEHTNRHHFVVSPENYSKLLQIWPTNIRMLTPDATRESLIKGWIKSFYLMVGAASKGKAWEECWAEQVRAYLNGDDTYSNLNCVGFSKNPYKLDFGRVFYAKTLNNIKVYISIWGKYVCTFGLQKEAVADMPGKWIDFEVIWGKNGPIVYGK